MIEKAYPGPVAVIAPVQVVQNQKNLQQKLAEGKKPSLVYPLTESRLGKEPGTGRPPDPLDRLADALLHVGMRASVANMGPDGIDKTYCD